MKKCMIFLCVFLVICLSGCGAPMEETLPPTTISSETNSESTLPQETDPRVLNSLASEGNNYRLQCVLDKIRSGDEVNVGFIGGSITEGLNAGKARCYASLVTKYLDETYSDGTGKVHCINAGLSGTPSMLGLVRAERELLCFKPDLIFIEFAVNDAQSFNDRQAFESLIRKCLLMDNAPAVIVLYSITDSGYTCQDDMALTAFYYGLPTVSVRDAIMPEMEAGNMKWSDWSDDEAHPHVKGHELYSRFICHLIDTLAAQPREDEMAVTKTGRLKRDWSSLREFDSTSLPILSLGSFEPSSAHDNFPNSWSYAGQKAGENGELTFEFTGKALLLVYKATKVSYYGTAEVLVDGEVVAHLVASTPDGWNNPVTQVVFSEKESAHHTVTIRMQAGDEGKSFDLLSVGIAE